MVLKEVYRENFANGAADLAAATPTWEIRPSKYNQRMFGPFNIIWVFNDADEKLQVRFNGQSGNYVIVNPNTVFGTNLEDGLNFNFIDIVNLDAGDPAASEVRVRLARIKDVPGEV